MTSDISVGLDYMLYQKRQAAERANSPLIVILCLRRFSPPVNGKPLAGGGADLQARIAV